MKSKRILSGFLVVTLLVGCLSGFSLVGFAADSGEKDWPLKRADGLRMPFRPENNYVSSQNAPDFLWPAVNGAESYELKVCSDAELTDIKYEVKGRKYNMYTFPHTMETGVDYYWSVRYKTAAGYGTWSDARRFRIAPDAHEFVYPGIEEVAKNIPESHPRIYVTQETLSEVRSWKDKNEYTKRIYDKIISEADEYVAAGTVAEEPGPDYPVGNLLGAASAITSPMELCAVAYTLTGDKKYGEYAVKLLMAVSEWDINGRTSYKTQDQVHRSIAFKSAIAYDHIYDLMTDAQRKKARDMIVERTKVMEYLLEYLRNSPFESHGWTAYGYMGIIAIALYEDAPEAKDWFEQIIDGYVSLLPPWSYQDGGWSQGTGYWMNSTQSNKTFTEVLMLGGYINLYEKAFSKNELYEFMYVLPPGGFKTFGDGSSAGSFDQPDWNYLLESMGKALAAEDDKTSDRAKLMKWYFNQHGGLEENLEDWVLLASFFGPFYIAAMVDDVEANDGPVTYPLAHEFSDIGWVTMTNDLISKDRINLEFKSSWYGSWNHSHGDQNAFRIDAFGQPLAINSGYYDSMGSNHDWNFTRTTGAHNTVTVATNKGQPVNDITRKGYLTGFLHQQDFDMVAGEAGQAYNPALDSYERCIIYVRPDIFVVVDELDGGKSKKEKFEWWLHAAHDMQMYEDGRGARIQEGPAVLDAAVQYPKKIKAYYNDNFALSDMKEYLPSGRSASSPSQTRVWFETEKVERTKMVVTMDVHRNSVDTRNIDTQYYDNYIKMTFEDGTVILVNLQKTGEMVTTEEGITFDGAAVTYNDESIMLSLGTTLKWGDVTLVQAEERASVVMGVNELGISSYTDQKIAINTNNDYISGITKVTNYDGAEISAAYGITMEQGMLAPAEGAEDTAVNYEVVPSEESVVFTVDKDNYQLMLNEKLITAETLKGTVEVVVEGEGTKTFDLSGYMRRDGKGVFNGSATLDGVKYTVEEISEGLSFDSLAAGDTKALSEVIVSSDRAENRIVLSRVPVFDINMDTTKEHEKVKESATVFIEAEKAISIGSGNVYTTRAFMSGGAGITNHNTPGTSLGYEVVIPEDGEYMVSLNYVAWLDGGAIRGLTMDGKAYNLNLPKTDGWGSAPEEWTAANSQKTISLKAGKYTIYIEALKNSWNLDWIAFTKK